MSKAMNAETAYENVLNSREKMIQKESRKIYAQIQKQSLLSETSMKIVLRKPCYDETLSSLKNNHFTVKEREFLGLWTYTISWNQKKFIQSMKRWIV